LREHIEIAIKHNLPLVNMAVEPLSISELYKSLYGNEFVNEISSKPLVYDMLTKYDYLFGGNNGYIFSKEKIVNEIADFVGCIK
jgi:hypothetical protein